MTFENSFKLKGWYITFKIICGNSINIYLYRKNKNKNLVFDSKST